jgi:hypothetical protein
MPAGLSIRPARLRIRFPIVSLNFMCVLLKKKKTLPYPSMPRLAMPRLSRKIADATNSKESLPCPATPDRAQPRITTPQQFADATNPEGSLPCQAQPRPAAPRLAMTIHGTATNSKESLPYRAVHSRDLPCPTRPGQAIPRRFAEPPPTPKGPCLALPRRARRRPATPLHAMPRRFADATNSKESLPCPATPDRAQPHLAMTIIPPPPLTPEQTAQTSVDSRTTRPLSLRPQLPFAVAPD